MMPVAYAAMRGLPIVDGDGMGRAFPALQMTSFNIEGVACAPLTIADEHGNSVLYQTTTGLKAAELARPVAAAVGASVCISCYPMTGAEARRAAIPKTLRSEEHTTEPQSLMRISYAVFCLKKKNTIR